MRRPPRRARTARSTPTWSREPSQDQPEDEMPHRRLAERASVRQQRRHALLTTRWVKPVDEEGQGVQGGVLGERHRNSEPTRLEVGAPSNGAVRKPEERTVEGVDRKPGRAPPATPRHRLAQQGDVRVVTAKEALVEWLEQSPSGRSDGPGERFSSHIGAPILAPSSGVR